MRWLSGLLACWASMSLLWSAPAATFYVAPNGRDNWTGKLPAPNARQTEGPFATLSGARDAIRKARAAGRLPQDKEILVLIRAGKYTMMEPLVFGPEDSFLTFAAYPQEKPQIIGGRLLSGLKPGPEGVWTIALSDVQAGRWNFRSLFVNGQRMIRARHPNYDPSDPYRKGFLYVGMDPHAFGISVGNIHNVGDWMEYKITVPADGEYTFWVYYGAHNEPFGRKTMDGRTAISVDGGEKIPLVDLPDTGSWAVSRWGKSATLKLTAGEHILRWENLQGGGLNLEAFALSDDPQWKPEGDRLPPVGEGKHKLLIQAESFVAFHGPQLTVSGSGRGDKDKFYYAQGDIKPSWAQAPEAEIHIFQTGNCRAFKEICWIERIDEAERLVYLKGPECTSTLHVGDRYFVENVRELLDAPGEFYLDRQAGILYLKPPAGFTPQAEILAPYVGRLMEAVSPNSEQPLEGLRFQGLIFRGGDWDFEDGCRGYGMGLNGVLYFKNARRCEIRGCRFYNIGKDAICLDGGERNIIAQNDITDSAEGGINIINSHDNEIVENHIHHIGRVYKHNGAITLQNRASRNLVARNVVHDLPRYGITMKNAGLENVIAYNRVGNTNLETYDTGGIEVTQHDREERSGTKIVGNIVADTIGYSSTGEKPTFLSWSIYLDSFAGGYTVQNNLCYRSMHGGIMFQGGKDNIVTNNILLHGQAGQGHISNFAGNMTGCVLERNIVAWENPQAYLWAGPLVKPENIRVDYNLYFCPGLETFAMGWGYKTFAAWREAGYDAHSRIADPLFVNPAADNYDLRPESPAFQLGFQKIDFSQVPKCACRIIPLGKIYFENLPWPENYP